MSPDPAGPRTLVLAFDTFGDIVLRQPLLTRLADEGHRLTVAVRRGYEIILPFLEPRAQAITTDINPYTPGDETIWARVDQFRAALLATEPEVVVSAPFNRTFLDDALLPGFSGSRRYGFRRPPPPAQNDAVPLLTDEVAVVEESPEVDKNRALYEAIVGRAEELPAPRIQLTDEVRAEAARILVSHGLPQGRYVVGCPAGTTVTALKAWPRDDYVELVRHLHRTHGLPVLLAGVSAEEDHLRAIASAVEADGVRAPIWIGSGDTLGTFLGLIAASRLYLGSDSGPMHFAAALGVPVVVRFGGGHWRRFLPSAASGLVVTQQLPCFGCNWDCWLEHPACIHSASTETVREGIDVVLGAGGGGLRVEMGQPLQGLARRMAEEGPRRYRDVARELRSTHSTLQGERGYRVSIQANLEASERDRAARLEYIHQLQRQAREQEHALEILRANVEGLYRQVGFLSTASGAARVLGGAGLQKAGLYDLAHRHRGLLKKLIPLKGPPRSPAPAAPAQDAAAPETRPSLLDAFVLARTLPGDTHELALERLYHLGARMPEVLCVDPTPRNVQAAYMLASGGARVTVLGSPDLLEGLSVAGLIAGGQDLEDWLVSRAGVMAPCDGVLLDAEAAEGHAALLHGRVPSDSALLVNGPGSRAVAGAATGTEETGDLTVTRPAPGPWRDPGRESLPSGRPWPRISVVTATLNQGRFLEDTLRSVLGQEYPNLEYIVVDGGSTDETATILERYRDRLAHCVSGPDEGQADALNKGFALATGDILAWLNSDDRYPPDALRRAALAFDAWGADMVVGGCAVVQEKGDEVVSVHHPTLPLGRLVDLPLARLLDIDGSWTQGDFFYQPEVFWTRGIWEKAGGGVAKELYYSMDYELWLRLAESGARIVHVPDTLAVYRMHAAQKTAGGDLPYVPELRRVASRHGAAGAAGAAR